MPPHHHPKAQLDLDLDLLDLENSWLVGLRKLLEFWTYNIFLSIFEVVVGGVSSGMPYPLPPPQSSTWLVGLRKFPWHFRLRKFLDLYLENSWHFGLRKLLDFLDVENFLAKVWVGGGRGVIWHAICLPHHHPKAQLDLLDLENSRLVGLRKFLDFLDLENCLNFWTYNIFLSIFEVVVGGVSSGMPYPPPPPQSSTWLVGVRKISWLDILDLENFLTFWT